jgi:hypothetical protein
VTGALEILRDPRASLGTPKVACPPPDPAGGSYDLWIANTTAQTTISGTMYITENPGNHP